MPLLNRQAVSRLRNWLQVLTRDRLDNVPILAEHLNVTAAITGALLCVIKRVLAGNAGSKESLVTLMEGQIAVVPDSSTDNLSKAGLEFGLGLID